MSTKKPELNEKYPKVSIVIVNWNKLEDTLLCLKHARSVEYPNYEIVLVDNGSELSIREKLNKQSNITYVQLETNTGFTGGHIAGLKASKGDYILLLNNDAVISQDYLLKAIRHFKKDDKVAAVGGRAYWWDGENELLSTKNIYYSYQSINPVTAEAITHQVDSGVSHEANNVSGSCVLISKAAINQVGYLYDPFFAYYEETDLFARMKRTGMKIIYDPELAIWHRNGSSSSAYFQYRQLFKNRFLFAVRNFDDIHIKKFLRNYFKVGVISTIYSLKPGSGTIHRAFRNAFFSNIINFGIVYKSRKSLEKTLGKSNYNEKLYSEQELVSFVIDTSENKITKTSINKWRDYANINEELEFIFVTQRPELFKNIDGLNNVRIVIDLGFSDSLPSNIGWLSTKSPFIIFSNISSPPTLSKKDLNRLIYKCKVQGEIATNHNPNTLNTLLVSRELLEKAGGLFVKKTNEDALHALLYYAKLRYKPRLSKDLLSYVGSNAAVDTKTKSCVEERVLFDNRLESKSTVWSRYIDRHYRIFQLRNYFKWLSSRKISLRLKLARSKNLFLYGIRIDRTKMAIELQHIRNELIKSTPGMFNITQQNEMIDKIIPKNIKNYRETPIFIICRDRLSGLEQLISKLDEIKMKRIFIIDNDSIFPPLIDYYRKVENRIQLIKTGSNIGHTVPWKGSIIKTLVPENFYIVTDPDVIPIDECPENFVAELLKLHKKHRWYQKIGLGLKIDDLPDYYVLKDSVIEWESQFWKNKVGQNIFDAGVDTTFAVYKPYTYTYFINPSLRTGGNLVARHLPWYADSSKSTLEDLFYRERADKNITSWNVDELPERYKEEMGLN